MHSNNNIVLGKLKTLFILHIYLCQLMALFFAMDCTFQRQTQLRGSPILNLTQKPECGSSSYQILENMEQSVDKSYKCTRLHL